MAIFRNSSFGIIFLIIGLYSMCHVIEVVQGRFPWDLSLYCINYCSRATEEMPPIGVCSCHRITSYQRRMIHNDLQTAPKQDFQNYNYKQPMENYMP